MQHAQHVNNTHETVDTQDQTSSVVLLGLAVLGAVVTVGGYLLIGG